MFNRTRSTVFLISARDSPLGWNVLTTDSPLVLSTFRSRLFRMQLEQYAAVGGSYQTRATLISSTERPLVFISMSINSVSPTAISLLLTMYVLISFSPWSDKDLFNFTMPMFCVLSYSEMERTDPPGTDWTPLSFWAPFTRTALTNDPLGVMLSPHPFAPQG